MLFTFSDNTAEKRDCLFSSSPAPGSFVCPFLAWLVLCRRYFMPFSLLSTQLQSHHSLTHPASLHPAPFHTAQGLAETHTPLSPSLRPPYTPTSPAHRGQRGRKRKRKSFICQSEITDCHLLSNVPSVRQSNGTFYKEKRATSCGRWQFWDVSVC